MSDAGGRVTCAVKTARQMLLENCHIIYNDYIMQLPDHVGHCLLETALCHYLVLAFTSSDGCIVHSFFFLTEGWGRMECGRGESWVNLSCLCVCVLFNPSVEIY